jgi:hypothetical protein
MRTLHCEGVQLWALVSALTRAHLLVPSAITHADWTEVFLAQLTLLGVAGTFL